MQGVGFLATEKVVLMSIDSPFGLPLKVNLPDRYVPDEEFDEDDE
jgi:hypothetical protein